MIKTIPQSHFFPPGENGLFYPYPAPEAPQQETEHFLLYRVSQNYTSIEFLTTSLEIFQSSQFDEFEELENFASSLERMYSGASIYIHILS